MRVFSLVLVSVLISTNFAAADIHSGGKWAKDYPEVIVVTINGDDTATFQYCEGLNNKDCRYLGSKEKYKFRDLRRREQLLKQQRRTMLLSDATFIATSAFASLIAAFATAPAGPVAIAMGAISGAATGGTFVLKGLMDPGKDGSRAVYKAPRTLTEHILNGEAVEVKVPINEFAQELDEILKQIF